MNSLENWYRLPDPWGYQVNPEDSHRKKRIIEVCNEFCDPKTTLDVGAGEGWITTDLPGEEIYGYEISDIAADRFPDNITRFMGDEDETFDLVVATGVLYAQYDFMALQELIHKTAKKHIVTSHIRSWEIPLQNVTLLYEEIFPYRQYEQRLCVYEVTP